MGDKSVTAPSSAISVDSGRPLPFGATLDDTGCNFSIYSPHATQFELLFFATHDEVIPIAAIPLASGQHRPFQIWDCRKAWIVFGDRVADARINLRRGDRDRDQSAVLATPTGLTAPTRSNTLIATRCSSILMNIF
jgi:pullulanase/glycogen debranching enzyme